MANLSSPVDQLPRIGKVGAKYLKKLGLETIQDLLFYLPFRYDDFRNTANIADLLPGEKANIRGEVMLIQNKRSFKRKMYLTEALIADETDTIKALWFNQPFLTRTIKIGDKISLAGQVTENQGQLAFVSPQYEKIYSEDLIHTAGLIPNYHLTEGITQKQIRYFIKQALRLVSEVKEWLPTNVQATVSLLPLPQALRLIHNPASQEEAEKARQRLAFSELFLRQIKSQLIKKETASKKAPVIKFQEKATRDFVSWLPFQLTDDQKKSAWEILQDISKGRPMSRLLEGDVGSGKTIVAALAMFNAARNGYKSTLMAPTEILAKQHFASLGRLFSNIKTETKGEIDLRLALLTGSRKDPEINKADIIIGTHALIQKNVTFKDLGLAIVDEQHRFGVKQRQNILDFNRKDETVPHFLSMTATPIPRSLALAIYGDLDLSIIKTLPAGRKKILTRVVKDSDRKKAYNFIREQIKIGRQAFVICPLIDDSDRLEVKSVKAEYERLSREVFPDLKIGLLHGKMKAADKEAAMQNFADKKTDILVSTSVIEVGVDVPNATVIAIEGAERFGLAQLHQFRGRVGRSEHQSYCLLFPSQEEITNEKTLTRLKAMENNSDGFALAKIDLKLRGAGDPYGDMQSGFSELQIASLFDYELIKKSNEAAANIIQADASLRRYPVLKEKLGEWEKKIHLE